MPARRDGRSTPADLRPIRDAPPTIDVRHPELGFTQELVVHARDRADADPDERLVGRLGRDPDAPVAT